MLLSWAKGAPGHHRKCRKIKEISTSETTVSSEENVPSNSKKHSLNKQKKQKRLCAYGLNNKQQKQKNSEYFS